MKKIILIICLLPIFAFSQVSYKIIADSTILKSISTNSNELVIRNSTKDTTTSVLYNNGNGVTQFKKVRVIGLNDSTYVVKIGTLVVGDTIKIHGQQSLGGTVTSVATDVTLTGGPIISSGTLKVDTTIISTKNYALNIGNNKATFSALDDSINAVRSIRKVDTIYRTAGKDSIIYKINGLYHSIKDSLGGGENLQQTINNGSNITNPSIIVSNLNAGSPVDGVAFIIYPDTTNNTVSSFAYSNDSTHITGSQTKAIVGTNLQLVQMGIYDETSTLDTADLKLMFVNNAGVEKAYFTGLTTNNNTDKFIGVNSATKEIYEIDTSFYVSKNYLNSIGLGSVTSVATGYGLSGGPITTSGTLLVDTSNIASKTYVNSKVASSGGSSSLSSLTAATATNTIDNKAYQQTWKWDSLSSGTGMKISTASTLASGNTQTLFEIEQTGTNATSSLKTYATKIKSTKSSNSNSNVALYLEASGVSSSGPSNSRALEIGGGEIYINTGGTTNPYFRFASGAYWFDNTVGLQTFNAPAGTNTGFSFEPNSVYGINFKNHFSSTAGFGFSNYSSTRNAMLFGAQGYFASYYAQQASAVVLERDKDVFSISADSATGSFFFTPTKILSVRGKTTNVGIGTQLPDASAILDLTSTTKGFLPPRMTSTQGSALTPIEGLLIYVTDTNGTFTSKGWWGYNGSAWEKLNN